MEIIFPGHGSVLSKVWKSRHHGMTEFLLRREDFLSAPRNTAGTPGEVHPAGGARTLAGAVLSSGGGKSWERHAR